MLEDGTGCDCPGFLAELSSPPFILFVAPGCPACQAAEDLLEDTGTVFTRVEVRPCEAPGYFMVYEADKDPRPIPKAAVPVVPLLQPVAGAAGAQGIAAYLLTVGVRVTDAMLRALPPPEDAPEPPEPGNAPGGPTGPVFH